MEANGDCRLELVPTRLVRRVPALRGGAPPKMVEQARGFARERGHCRPVVLSESDGCMALLAGAAAFEVCAEESEARIPAVIVRTKGEADDLMFALQSAALDETPDAVAVSGAIVRLLDSHGATRKQIAQTLGKSPAWISRMENLGRKLNATVRGMVADGLVAPRAAQEIARLPDDAQAPFAVAASNQFLCKDDIAYLVNRFLDGDTGAEERGRIIRAPWHALPHAPRRRGRMGDCDSYGARLSRAIARCLDSAWSLSRLLDKAGEGAAAMRTPAAIALAESLPALHARMLPAIALGEAAAMPLADAGGTKQGDGFGPI